MGQTDGQTDGRTLDRYIETLPRTLHEHCNEPKTQTGSKKGGYIFYAGGSLAGAGYCRQCRRRPAILPLQLWLGCQVCVKISAQRLPRLAQFNAR